MRSILIGLVSTAALVSSMNVADCTFDFPEDQTSYALCDRPSIASCLSAVPESNRLDFLEQCLLDGGCSEADATSITETIAGHCENSQQDGSWGDLKKRQKKSTSAADAKTTKAPTSAAQTTEPATSTDAQTTADTTTDAPSTKPSASSTPASTTPSSTTSPSTTSSSTTSSTTTTTSSTSGKLVCLTTSQSSITWCLTTTGANAATGTNCIPTFTPIISCVAGLICQTGSAGDTTCMERQNNLTTSGLVVTIIFGTVVFAFLAALLGMCIKSRRASRNQTKQREAAMIAGAQEKNNAAAAQAAAYSSRRMESVSEAHLPLMAAPGPAGGERDGNMGEYREGGRPTAHRVPSNSYQDVVASRVPVGGRGMSPGMMELETDEDDMGYRGPRGGI